MAADRMIRIGKRAGAAIKSAGFSLIEVLVALVIVVVGLLGLIGLQGFAQQSEFESYQRAQALILLNDMMEKINTNRSSATCFGMTNELTGTPYFGTTGAGHVGTIDCASGYYNNETRLLVNQAMQDWDESLRGVTETKGGNAVSALVGARGCVSRDAATNTFTVAVVWQGMTSTFNIEDINCARGLYGGDANRRVVWATVRIATLR
jgi:type IV pilus assembly protein PilV